MTKTYTTMAEFIDGKPLPPTVRQLMSIRHAELKKELALGMKRNREALRYLTRIDAKLAKARGKLPDGAMEFQWEFNPQHSYRPTSLIVNGTGDALKEIFKVMRGLGFEPSSRPGDKPASSFYCDWRRFDGERDEVITFLGFSFYSTVCEYKQVGTQMKEMPIYEVVCK